MYEDFVSDLEFKDMEYAQLIRANEADCKLIDIEVPELPNGFSFFSAKDIVGKNFISILGATTPVFAYDKIEYAGQVVGILVGADKQKLYEVAKNINVKTESNKKFKAQFTFEEETKNYFDYPIIAKENLSNGDIELIFDTSKNIVYSTFALKQRYHYHAEPLCVKTNWTDNRLEIHIATQWPFHILESVSDVLSIDKSKINIVLHNDGEPLDERIWFPSLIASQIAVASFLTKKNIVLEFSRQEDFLYTTKSPSALIQHKSAVSDDGSITAMEISIILDSGNFTPFINTILKHMVVTAIGMYNLPAYTINAIAIKTNCGLTDLFIGWGDTYVTSALEKHINEIAVQLNLCPVEFRLKNNLHNGEDQISGIKTKVDFDIENLFKATCAASDFYRKYSANKLLNAGRKNRYDGNWRGIGIACGYKYNGSNILIKSGMTYGVELTLTKENKALVKAEPISEDLKKIFRKQIAKELEIEENAVVFLGGSTDLMLNTGADTAACGVSIIPDLITKCCAGIKKQRFRKPLPITICKTHKIVKSKDWDNQALKGSPFISTTPAVCAIELELNRSTYTLKTKGIWFACNAGKIYSKKLAIQNIHKSIATAISNITIEKNCEWISKPSQYKIITAGEIPPIKVFISDSELKSRAIGEIAESLVVAAYMSALNQIMLNYQKIDSIPVFTEDIFKAIRISEVSDAN